MNEAKQLQLEQDFVDAEGLTAVIGELADICMKKAEWTEANWQAPLNQDGRLERGWSSIYTELLKVQRKIRSQACLLQGKPNNFIPETNIPMDGERIINEQAFIGWAFIKPETIQIFQVYKAPTMERLKDPTLKLGWQDVPDHCKDFSVESLWHLEGYGFSQVALSSNSFKGADFTIKELLTTRKVA